MGARPSREVPALPHGAPRVGKETCDLRFCTGPHIGPEVDNMTLRSRLERLEQCLPRGQKGPDRIIYTGVRPALNLTASTSKGSIDANGFLKGFGDLFGSHAGLTDVTF